MPRSYGPQKIRLWKKDPRCFYCGRVTVLQTNIKPTPDNLATIDHLNSRYNPNRIAPNLNGERRRVLCCYGCNQKRNDAEQQNIPVEVLRERSGRWPSTQYMCIINWDIILAKQKSNKK